ncbi:hypothetical protein B4N89_46485 [Embleya scabrispora]|uniref:Uncharacterized protein n=1 Tax=Embleya scabrispora TaxID=159449 RepID=A0A1T3NIE6_9ACTN|nr:hypothetical protein [Embleya scabrispora]OPC76485.1 hypothetical protein B4N89_46485 [Embleya scabrispora]
MAGQRSGWDGLNAAHREQLLALGLTPPALADTATAEAGATAVAVPEGPRPKRRREQAWAIAVGAAAAYRARARLRPDVRQIRRYSPSLGKIRRRARGAGTTVENMRLPRDARPAAATFAAGVARDDQ